LTFWYVSPDKGFTEVSKSGGPRAEPNGTTPVNKGVYLLHKVADSLTKLLGDFPQLPVPERLNRRLEDWLKTLPEYESQEGKDELYQEDAGTGSRGKSAEER
jgi:hypothetical protein